MDIDQDGRMSPAEQARYFSSLGETLAAGLELSVNGRHTPLTPVGEVKLTMPFTKTYRFAIPHPDNWTSGAEIELHNDNYMSLPGTVTIVLDPGDSSDITHKHVAGKALGDSGGSDLSETQERDIVFRYCMGTGQQATDANPRVERQDQTTAPPPPDNRTLIIILSVTGALAAAALIGPIKHPVAACIILLGAGVVMYATCMKAPAIVPNNAQAASIFRDLHEGIYRAFNARSEDEIYDTLAMSLQGQLLDKVYNEVHQTVAMRKNKQMSFRVRRVKAISTEVTPSSGSTFQVRHHWRVYGTVTHLAHSHARFNEYQAVYTVVHNGNGWRISDSQIRRHKRVTVGQS
jgi:hypothetical protein